MLPADPTSTLPAAPPRARLTVLWRVLLPMVALLAGLDAGLAAVVGPLPARQGYSALSSSDGIRLIGRRVAAVQAQLDMEHSAGPPLAVVVGLSTAREGIDPVHFQRASTGQYRLLNLAASGGSFSELADYCQPLLNSGLRPALLVVGVHPSWLAGRVAPVATPLLPARVDRAAMRDSGRALRDGLMQRSWILHNRLAIHEQMRDQMLGLRARLGGHLGVLLRSVDATSDPWAVASGYQDERAAPAFLDTQLKQWQALGWFDAARVHEQGADAPVLRTLLQSLGTISPRVVVVLMPESEQFRARVPPAGAQAILAIAGSVEPGVTVLDLRGSMPVGAFRDQAHLNAAGRGQFSALLVQALQL